MQIPHIRTFIRLLLCGIACFLGSDIYGAAATRDTETLVVAREAAPNSFDMQGVGSNRAATTISWNIYDRLVSFGRKQLPSGEWVYNRDKIEPRLAESWEYDADGTSLIFHLRKNTKFHDGTPVTAADVKWSFDRGLSIVGFSQGHMKALGIDKPSQFIVIDDNTFKIQLAHKDKLTFQILTSPIASIYNSKLAKQHVTDQDPWAQDWLRTHDAGGGAFKVESFIQDVQTVFTRYDDWLNGPMPKLKKVTEKVVPSPILRKDMLENGEIDIAFELPPKLFEELVKSEKFTVIGVPIENQMVFLDMNVTKAPFDNLKVRQAMSYAIPYEAIFHAAVDQRGVKLYGATSKSAETLAWPQPYPYHTDLATAKKLLAEAGYPEGFATELYYDLGEAQINKEIAELVQEQLKKINITVTIKKVPADQWRAMMGKKEMPLLIGSYSGWANYPEYFFFWNYHGQNAVFNTMSYQNPEMDRYIEGALQADTPEAYEKNVKALITKAFVDVPRIPLFQKYLDIAMQKNVHGYTYWYHTQLDYKPIYKD